MKFGLSEEIYNKIEKIVKENKKYKFKIFGSRAKNTYKNTSDIDIAIFENVSKEDEYKIKNQFDLLNIIYKIDLVFIDKNTKKEFLEEIKRVVENAEWRKEAGALSREIATPFDKTEFGNAVEKIYNEVTE